MLSNRVAEMAVNGKKRSGGVMVPFPQLVLPTQSSWVTGVSRVVIIFGYMVLNLKQVGLNRLFCALLAYHWSSLVGIL